ncbi:hypothetical protein BGZ76_011121, partial [Entomortierella beljakovae]
MSIILTCLIYVSFVKAAIETQDPDNGLLASVVLSLFSWIIAAFLNEQEHKYEVRSSDFLFGYYFTTICTNVVTLYIFYVGNYDEVLFNHALCLTLAISGAAIIEGLPRKNTRVQRLAREKENMNEWQQANLLSRLSFHYFQPVVITGASRPLTGDDLDSFTPAKVMTNVNYKRLASQWNQEKTKSASKNKLPSFFWTGIRTYNGELLFIMSTRLFGFALFYIPPVLFGHLLQFIDNYSTAVRDGLEPPSRRIGFAITSLMFFFNVLCTFVLSHTFLGMTDLGIQVRGATIALIYRKSLKLSPQARQSCTIGEITNHMSVDAERWIDATLYMPFLITAPFELLIAIYLLYQLLGWCLFAGLAVFAVLVPIQTKAASFMNIFQDDHLKWMDSRLRVMTELLSNIKIIKLYHWEAPMRKKIDVLRAMELKALKGLATIRSILTIIFTSVTLLMAFFSFWAFAYYGGPNMTPGKLTPEIVFVSVALFSTMNRPLGLAAHTISRTIAVTVAMGRIQKFLLLEELDTTVVRRYSRRPHSGKDTKKTSSVDIENATFMWEKPEIVNITDSDDLVDGERQPLLANARTQPVKPTLSNINLRISDGNLTAIVGRIGQGKSSLLSAIMGEMYKNAEGTVTVYGDIAYVPQQAWIINATVRDNILFGKPFDKAKYDEVIYASGLTPDLEMLSAGDRTEIGERGINLSGGQKQRVSLARAAYQDADIYLLDDPLSAVDAHVDRHLWEHLIGPDSILSHKTRILVTHGIHHLENVDQIVLLKHGKITEEGEYQKLMKAHGPFYKLIKEFSVGNKKKGSSSKSHLRNLILGKKGNNSDGSKASDSATSSIKEGTSDSEEGDASESNTITEDTANKTDKKNVDEKIDSGELIADEKMEAGRVGWGVTAIYAEAATYRTTFICIVLFVLTQACHVGTNFWLRYWISDTQTRENEGAEPRPVSYYLTGYGELVVLYIILDVIVNYVTEVVCGIRASIAIYDRLLTRVLRMPMSFFDTTPMGRIVNRFSSDIYAIDMQLPEEWNDLFSFISIIGGTLFVVAYSTPAFLIAIPPLIATYFWIQHYFIKSSSSLKRLCSVSRSPLYQHFSESISGVSTIRAMKGLSEQFIAQNEAKGDVIINRFICYNLDNRWLQIRLEALGGFTVFLAGSLSVWYAAVLDPSLVGLALSYALNMIGFINYLVRTVNEVQNLLVSVERVDEYSQKPIEAPVETGARISRNWPSQGRIVFKNYSARYREGLDLVVKDISFVVEPTQSVGIVGRTGAGKSSLTLALFRIIEAADSYWARASDPSYAETHPLADSSALYSTSHRSG